MSKGYFFSSNFMFYFFLIRNVLKFSWSMFPWYQIVLEADGYQPYLISPEKGLRSLIKGVLELAKEPSKLCVDEVQFYVCHFGIYSIFGFFLTNQNIFTWNQNLFNPTIKRRECCNYNMITCVLMPVAPWSMH